MLIYAYNALFIALCHVGLALFVLFRDSRSKLNHWFVLVCISVFCWSFGLYKHTLADSLIQARFWDLFLHLSAIFIPWAFLHFCFVFIHKKRNLIVNLIDISTLTLFLVFLFKPSFFMYEITDKPHFNYFPTAMPGYVVYTGGFFVLMIYMMLEIWLFSRKTDSILYKQQVKYFLTGLIIAFIGASTNFFAVFFKNVYPIGCYLVGIFAFTVGYAIIKHRLMDIDVFIRRGLIYLGVFLILLIPSSLFLSYLQNVIFDQVSALFTVFMVLTLIAFGLFFLKLNQLIEPKLIQLASGRGYNYESVIKRINYGISHYSNLNDLLHYFTHLIADTFEVNQVCLVVNSSNKFKMHEESAIINQELEDKYKYFLRNESLLVLKENTIIKEEILTDKKKENILDLMQLTGVELITPIYYEDKIEGLLLLGKKENRKLFTGQDIDLLKVFSLNIGIVLNNESYKVIEALNKHLKDKTEHLEKAMEELTNTQLQLVHSAKLASMGQLAAGVAHELNNALNASISSTRVLNELLNEADDDLKKNSFYESSRNVVRILTNGMNRAHGVVKNLLTFSKKNSEGYQYQNIHEGINSTIQILKSQLDNRVQVHCDFCQDGEVFCDLNQLNQVFLNLIMNSYDAIKGNGNIWIKTVRDDQSLRLSIKDDGIGIAEDVCDKIFDPFFTTKDVGKGTGLGLSVSYNIVKDHGGIISCHSEEGNGTEFVIELPIKLGKEGAA